MSMAAKRAGDEGKVKREEMRRKDDGQAIELIEGSQLAGFPPR